MFLNLACGSKLIQSSQWINIDFSSPLDGVKSCNILRGLPYTNSSFDLIYSAQFVEHLTLPQLSFVLQECHRVLKPNGIIRLVTPDLEELTSQYLRCLKEVRNQPDSKILSEQYNWIRLEIFDQVVRDVSGGEMSTFLSNISQECNEFVLKRLGYSHDNDKVSNHQKKKSIAKRIQSKSMRLLEDCFLRVLPKNYRIGSFRNSGEVHRFLHDEHSLTTELRLNGFSNVARMSHDTSFSPDWHLNNLDIIDNKIDGPFSLILEGTKI